MRYVTRSSHMRRLPHRLVQTLMLLFLLCASSASAQDAEPAADKRMHGMRISLELAHLDFDASIPTGIGTVDTSHSGTGAFFGLEYLVATDTVIPLQASLGLFFEAPFIDGDFTRHSFYAPITVGSWIDLGARFRINASFCFAYAHHAVQTDSLAWKYRVSSISMGPLVGLSYMISNAKAQHRIELSGGYYFQALSSVIYNDGDGLIELDSFHASLKTPTLRLSFLTLLL